MRALALASLAGTLTLTLALGCQSSSKTSTSGSGNASQGGNGGAGGAGGGAGGQVTGGGGAGGGLNTCVGIDATVQDIASGVIGPGVDVEVTGAVAMSQKFLVSKSSSTGSCLWGVFISAPGLTETGEHTGVLALSYGDPATTADDGKTYCAKLGQVPTGGAIPDDIKPGDVVDATGETGSFILDDCATEPNGSTVPQRQLAKICSMVKTGEVTPPTPHVLTAAEMTGFAAPTGEDAHHKWAGVKVRLEGLSSVLHPEDPNDAGSTPVTVNQYGVIKLENGLEVGNKLFYRGYSPSKCHDAPDYPDTVVDFTRVDGFGLLDYCTWRIMPNDKCADLDPKSGDCGPDTSCPPDVLP
jgi:hypothetical protein